MKARLELALMMSASLLAPAVARAAWSVDPVTVHATTDACPLVAAASDAQDGAIVVWQQDDAANPGVFRLLAKRVLANGEVDAAWPADGALVSSMETVNRPALGALGDGSGGAYVWWMEQWSRSLYLTRILPDGTIAPGWLARGKSLGSLTTPAHRPLVFPDGQGGIWLGWLNGDPLATTGRISHLGPGGLGAGGWPTGGRGYAASSPDEGELQTLAFTFAPAPDGGAWVAWGDAMHDADGYHAGSWRLLRVASTGSVAPGWDAAGLPVRDFHGESLLDTGLYYYQPCFPPYFAASPVAVASDGAEGVYLFVSSTTSADASRLFHLDASGSPVPTWPAVGVATRSGGVDAGAEHSLRLFPEAAGGVFALEPAFYDHGTDLELIRFTPAGTRTTWDQLWDPRGFEAIVPPSGDAYLASCWPTGPTGPYSPYAHIALRQTYASGAEGPGFYEWFDRTGGTTYYGDIGLAPTSGAGAILAWSQVYERQGVFARRFTGAGQVAVEPGVVVAQALRLRFAPGRGVVATLGRVAEGRIQLHDVTGRACAGTDVPAGAREVTLEGTATLAPGLYFARHRGPGGAIETGRVVIVR
jgi:hypothetical protein